MKKILITILTIIILSGCARDSRPISLVTREEGSGTRGAFVDLFDIKDEEGNDDVSLYAEVTNSTAVMMMTIKGDRSGLGYISLGSLNDEIKALSIDGVKPTVDNIHNETYSIVRTFKLINKNENKITKDFLNFVKSIEGQAVVEASDYVSLESDYHYQSTVENGKLTIGGSSSVTPVIEQLTKAYLKLNPNIEIEVQQSDSTTGVSGTIEGITDIGMISRDLKGKELESGLKEFDIAKDGIVMIVNKENEVNNLSMQQVQAIYHNEIEYWSDLND